jgi:hypothetical protein
MDERQEHQPGAHGPATGHHEELNMFGTPILRGQERYSGGLHGR